MRKESAFTLVELLVVVLMISILSGIVGKLWSSMEKMSATVHRNIVFTMQSRILLDRLREDIHCSIQVSRSEESILILTQQNEKGLPRKIVYRMEGIELIRELHKEDGAEHSMKAANLGNLFLDVSFLKNGMIRLDVRRRIRERPMEFRNSGFTTYVNAVGVSI